MRANNPDLPSDPDEPNLRLIRERQRYEGTSAFGGTTFALAVASVTIALFLTALLA